MAKTIEPGSRFGPVLRKVTNLPHLHIVARASVFSNKTWEVMADSAADAIAAVVASEGYEASQLMTQCVICADPATYCVGHAQCCGDSYCVNAIETDAA